MIGFLHMPIQLPQASIFSYTFAGCCNKSVAKQLHKKQIFFFKKKHKELANNNNNNNEKRAISAVKKACLELC
jgi:tRNA A37 N6-isopentenylltransferase MiaA